MSRAACPGLSGSIVASSTRHSVSFDRRATSAPQFHCRSGAQRPTGNKRKGQGKHKLKLKQKSDPRWPALPADVALCRRPAPGVGSLMHTSICDLYLDRNTLRFCFFYVSRANRMSRPTNDKIYKCPSLLPLFQLMVIVVGVIFYDLSR